MPRCLGLIMCNSILIIWNSVGGKQEDRRSLKVARDTYAITRRLLFSDISLLGGTEVIERKCTHSKTQSERWKSTKRRKKKTQLLNKTGY